MTNGVQKYYSQNARQDVQVRNEQAVVGKVRRYGLESSEPVNKTTVVVMGMGFSIAALVIIILGSFAFVSCSTRPVVNPPASVSNPNCTHLCMN